MPDSQVPLTVVTPCYNEQEVIPFLADTLRAFERGAGAMFDLHYVFVDDGSRDDTWALLNRHFPPGERCVLLQHVTNQGIAGAILSGFAVAQTDFVAVIDSDCTFHPDQLAEMFDLMKDDVDVVVSSPLHAAGAMQNVPRWRQAMSHGAAFLYRLVLRQQLTSYTSCFRIFRRGVLKGLRLGNYGFCGVTEILVRLDLQGARFAEYPAVLGTREYGQSKINTLKTVLDHLQMVAKAAMARGFGRRLRDLPLPEVRHG